MSNPVRKATVKSTGKKIEVYRHSRGGWVDYPSCGVKYTDEELEFSK